MKTSYDMGQFSNPRYFRYCGILGLSATVTISNGDKGGVFLSHKVALAILKAKNNILLTLRKKVK